MEFISLQICNNFIPEGFFKKDILVGDQRHLLFATDYQLQLLSDMQTWYIDGTFKVNILFILMNIYTRHISTK